jgi:transposase
VSIGLAALDASGLRDVALDDATVTLRLLSDRRQELVSLRTQAICRLHRLLAELTPGGVRRELNATKAAAVLGRLRPETNRDASAASSPWTTSATCALSTGASKPSAPRSSQSWPRPAPPWSGSSASVPCSPHASSPKSATLHRSPKRTTSRATTAPRPIDASSGEQQRHRLSRAGNRRINHALHMAAVTQLRNPTSAGRAYYERKLAGGKTRKEALRCLKRRLSDVVFRQLVIDLQPAAATPNTITS